MEIHLHINIQRIDHIRNRIGNLFRQRAVLYARISAVDITHLASGKRLSRRVGIYVRIRPLVNRIGGTRAVYKLARTALCLKMIEMGRALLRIIMCECTVVGSGNYINRTGFHLTAFNHRDCRHMSRRLIGMSPAKYQERTSLFFTLHHIDSCIAECTF